MTPRIDYEEGKDSDEIRIRDIEQVEWVEWSRAQALDQKVQIESHFTDRDFLHNREITEVEFEDSSDKKKCERRLKVTFSMMFDEDFVEDELVKKRGVIEELVDQAIDFDSTGLG